jgi:hypothetical protein
MPGEKAIEPGTASKRAGYAGPTGLESSGGYLMKEFFFGEKSFQDTQIF